MNTSTYSIAWRKSKFRRGDSVCHNYVLDEDAATQIDRLADTIKAARENHCRVAIGMGAHLIKLGLGGYISDLLKQGHVTSVAMTGAAAFHDMEIAKWGVTSEDVNEALTKGEFGFAEESPKLFASAAKLAADTGTGLGQQLSEMLDESMARHSILAACRRHRVPVTIHVAIGCDVAHMHDCCDGASLGESSMTDFRKFCSTVESLTGGVYINIGSAVMMPEVFLKAVSLAYNHNLRALDGLVTADMDMQEHYRTNMNVLIRPTGPGIAVRARHEVTIPALHEKLVK